MAAALVSRSAGTQTKAAGLSERFLRLRIFIVRRFISTPLRLFPTRLIPAWTPLSINVQCALCDGVPTKTVEVGAIDLIVGASRLRGSQLLKHLRRQRALVKNEPIFTDFVLNLG